MAAPRHVVWGSPPSFQAGRRGRWLLAPADALHEDCLHTALLSTSAWRLKNSHCLHVLGMLHASDITSLPPGLAEQQPEPSAHKTHITRPRRPLLPAHPSPPRPSLRRYVTLAVICVLALFYVIPVAALQGLLQVRASYLPVSPTLALLRTCTGRPCPIVFCSPQWQQRSRITC